MSYTDALGFKIPNGNGSFNSYPIKDVKNYRTRRNITSDLANLAQAVSEQNLRKFGYEIGDYFVGASGIEYVLADMNTFKGSSDNYAVVGSNHITIVVNCTTSSTESDRNTAWGGNTSQGYNGSTLHSHLENTILPKVKSDFTALFSDWSSHLIGHQKLFRTGESKWAWGWQAGKLISALTSVQLHGSPICDLDGTDTGEGNKPLEVFQKFFYCEVLHNKTIWLRSISASGFPCGADGSGNANGHRAASASCGAVGLIIFH